jgi:hypothetical protein
LFLLRCSSCCWSENQRDLFHHHFYSTSLNLCPVTFTQKKRQKNSCRHNKKPWIFSFQKKTCKYFMQNVVRNKLFVISFRKFFVFIKIKLLRIKQNLSGKNNRRKFSFCTFFMLH